MLSYLLSVGGRLCARAGSPLRAGGSGGRAAGCTYSMEGVWNLFRRRHRGSDLRVKSRADHLSGARPESLDISAFAPSQDVVLAQAAYHHFAAYRLLSAWVGQADASAARFSFASAISSEYKAFARIHRVFRADQPEAEPRDNCLTPELLDAAFERVQPRTWQEAAIQVCMVNGILDDAHLAVAEAAGVPMPVRQVLARRRSQEKLLALLQEQIATAEFSRDLLALWGRAVIGDAILAVRGLLVLPEDVREALRAGTHPDEGVADALGQLDAFQSQLVAGHTLRMDALHLTA